MKQDLKSCAVLDRLLDAFDFDYRPMFGGFGLYREGQFFGIVASGHVYLKTWPQTVGRYQELGMQPFQPSPTTRLKTYFEVPPGVLVDPSQLSAWAEEAWGGFC